MSRRTSLTIVILYPANSSEVIFEKRLLRRPKQPHEGTYRFHWWPFHELPLRLARTHSTSASCSHLKNCVSAELVKTRGGSDHFEGGCFGRGSLPHARLRHSRQLVQHLVLHKCCLKITFRDFSPPSVIEIPRDFFADARNCIPRVCVKISSQKNQKRMRYFEKNLIFGAHCQSW